MTVNNDIDDDSATKHSDSHNMLVDLTQSDLELMTVVQHSPNLVAFIVPN